MTTFTVSYRRRHNWPTCLTTLLFLLAGSQCYAQLPAFPSPFNGQSWGQQLLFYPSDSVEFSYWPTRFGHHSGGEGDTILEFPDRPFGGVTVMQYNPNNTPAGTVVFSGIQCPNGNCPNLQGNTLYLVITGFLGETIVANPEVADSTRLLKLVVDDSSTVPTTSQTFYVRKRDAMGDIGLKWNSFREIAYPVTVAHSGRSRLEIRGVSLGADEGPSVYSVGLRDSLAQLVLGQDHRCRAWRREYLSALPKPIRSMPLSEYRSQCEQQQQEVKAARPMDYAALRMMQTTIDLWLWQQQPQNRQSVVSRP